MQFLSMKNYIYFFSLFISIFSSTTMAAETLDTVAVVVNDSIISQREVDNRFNDFKHQLELQGQRLPPENLLKKQVVERMILDKIQLQMASAQGIHIDDLTLNKMLEGIAQKNKTSLESMRRMLQRKGIRYEDFREQTRNDMIIRQLQQRMIYSRVKVSQQEIDIFLDQEKQSGDAANDKYHLAHILIATPEAASPEEVNKALNKAQSAKQDISQGKSFNDIALNYSDGRHALKGGDLGWRTAAELPPLFLDSARQMQKGEVSEPLRSAGGFHLIQLIDKKTQQHIIKQTHARHILIKPDQITSNEQARKQMQSIKKRLDQGEDFAKLAEEFSQDPGSKNNGGDLGWATEGTFVPRFTQVLKSLNKQQISEPFKTQFGWHIIQLLDRRQQDETEQLIRQKAEMAIQNRKADEELQLWLRQARDEAYVEFRVELGS